MKLEVSYLSELFEDEVLEEVSTDSLIAAANLFCEEWHHEPECRILDFYEMEMSIRESRITAAELFGILKDAEVNFDYRCDYFTWQKTSFGDFEIMDEDDAREYAVDIIQNATRNIDDLTYIDSISEKALELMGIEFEMEGLDEEG